MRAYSEISTLTPCIQATIRCIKAGAAVLGPKGQVHDENSIGAALASRELMDQLRQMGMQTGGPAPMDKRGRSAFLSQLDQTIQDIQDAIDAGDADISRFGGHGVDAHDADTGDRIGAYLALRVAGADQESVERAALVWIAFLLDLPEAAALLAEVLEAFAGVAELGHHRPDGEVEVLRRG